MGMTEGLPQKLKINSEIERWGKGARSEIGVTDRNTDCERECVCVCADEWKTHTLTTARQTFSARDSGWL